MRSIYQSFTVIVLLSLISLFSSEMANAQNLPTLGDFREVAPAWHPNGSTIAVAQSTSITIYDAQTLNIITVLNGHTDEVQAIAWHPNGTQLASGGRDNLIYIWDISTSTIVQIYNAHTDNIVSIDWSPDGSRIVSTAQNGDNNMHIWNTNTGATNITAKSGTGGNVKYNINGGQISLVVGYSVVVLDSSLLSEIVDIRTDDFGPINLYDRTNLVEIATWETNGNRLATGNIGGSVYVWNAATLQPINVLIATPNHNPTAITNPGATWVRDVVFTGDGDDRIISVTADGTLKVWNATTFSEIDTRQIQPVMAATFSPNGEQLAIIPQGTTNSVMIESTADLVANRTPIAEAGDPITVSNCDSNGGAALNSQGFTFPPTTPPPRDPNLRLDATASYDVDGTIATYEWRDAGGVVVANTAIADLVVINGFTTVTTTYTLTITDDDGAIHTDTIPVTIVSAAEPCLD
jgi:WD40 repeat protein